MAQINVANKNNEKTHEGAPAFGHLTPMQSLRRSVMSCLLWEDEFYEDGKTIADRIVETAKVCPSADVAALAIEARKVMHLRHVPLLLLRALVRTAPHLVAETMPRVISRADEMGEFLSLYLATNDGRRTFPRQMRLGLGRAMAGFDEYALAKYDRDGKVKLRDVLRIARPKPFGPEQSALWKRAVTRTLATPDTWEVALSGGKDKKETFERLLKGRKLGYLALLRNLRNMAEANVDVDLIREAILARRGGAQMVFPFRYVAAARVAPMHEPQLDIALQAAIAELPVLPGKTIVLIDVSGSMDHAMSRKSDMKRIDAAAALGAIVHGDIRLFTFSDLLREIPPRHGMAGVDAIVRSQPHGGTNLGAAIAQINANVPADRLIVVTDEQSHDAVPNAFAKGYMINVASNKNGVGYGKWTHIDGFSENVLRYINEIERSEAA
jgi:hypothetical protein